MDNVESKPTSDITDDITESKAIDLGVMYAH